jgi:hypothetical protein
MALARVALRPLRAATRRAFGHLSDSVLSFIPEIGTGRTLSMVKDVGHTPPTEEETLLASSGEMSKRILIGSSCSV